MPAIAPFAVVVTSIGLRLFGTRVADVAISPEIAGTLEVLGGTLSNPMDVTEPHPSTVTLRHYTVRPTTLGLSIVIRAAGPVRITAHPIVVLPSPMPETVALEDCTWCIDPITISCGNLSDFNGDGDAGTDADIEAFFACLGGNCCPSCTQDFDQDGDNATDADIDAFFRVLRGGTK